MPAARTIEDLPGPRRLPLLGNLHQLRPADDAPAAPSAGRSEFGPLYRIDLGPRRIVVVADPDIVNTVLRDRPDGYRRWTEIESLTEEIWGTPGVFSAEGEDWKRSRRLAVTALNSNHLQRYFGIIATSTERLLRRLESAAREGGAIDIGEALSAFTVDVTSALAFGRDLNTLEHGDGELQRNLHTVFHAFNRRLLAPFPYWRRVKLPADRELDRAMTMLVPAVEGFMVEARERIAARPELREKPENFLEGMIAAQERDGSFSDGEILGNVMTLLLAGEDTTSHTMSWTIWALATMPEVQARWAAEAGEVLGAERFPVDHESVDSLEYGEGVIRESMRLQVGRADRVGRAARRCRARWGRDAHRDADPPADPDGRLPRRPAPARVPARALVGRRRPRPEVVPRLRRRAALLPGPQPRLPRGEDGAGDDRAQLRDLARPGGEAGDRAARVHDEPERPAGPPHRARPGAGPRLAHHALVVEYRPVSYG